MKNNVIAIGIDKYKNVSNLNNCTTDLNKIINVLVSKYDFEESDIIKLYNEDATNENIINALEDLFAKQNSGENLIIFFSGHGDFDTKLDLGYFIPHEADLYKKNTYIPNTTILNYIRAFEYRHTVIISDSCFSGSIFGYTRKTKALHERLYDIPSKWALSSGRIEEVEDGVPGKNSPFAEAFYKILNNSDSNIGISEISNLVIKDVADQYEQIPRGAPLQNYGDKGGEFFFKIKIAKTLKTTSDKIKYDSKLPESLQNMIIEYFDFEEKLEIAENNNNSATSRRLKEELSFIKKSLGRDMIRYFELEKANSHFISELNSRFGIDIEKKLEDLRKIKIEKQEFVKQQDYIAARKAKDIEEELQFEISKIFEDKKVDFLDMLGNSEESIVSDYSIVLFLKEVFYSNFSFSNNNKIEEIFKDIFFYKLAKEQGKITKYRFTEYFDAYSANIKNIFNWKDKDSESDFGNTSLKTYSRII